MAADGEPAAAFGPGARSSTIDDLLNRDAGLPQAAENPSSAARTPAEMDTEGDPVDVTTGDVVLSPGRRDPARAPVFRAGRARRPGPVAAGVGHRPGRS